MMEVSAAWPDMVMPDNSRCCETIAAASMECRGCAKTTAAKYRAAAETTAMNGCATTAEATTSAAATETATTMAVATSDFRRQSVRGIFR